jgi:hypothetical protein
MRTPGYTADRSLRKGEGAYSFQGAAWTAESQTVVPQFFSRLALGECRFEWNRAQGSVCRCDVSQTSCVDAPFPDLFQCSTQRIGRVTNDGCACGAPPLF